MMLRIWRTGLNRARLPEYDRFERARSLLMVREQRGLVGVLFLRKDSDRAAALTMWEDMAAVDALAGSVCYQDAARNLAESGLLVGAQWIELFEVHHGELHPRLCADLPMRT